MTSKAAADVLRKARALPRPVPPTPNKCRACGCTDESACDEGCSWVSVEQRSRPLCSACAGTEKDLAEALRRIDRLARIAKGGFEVVYEAARIARAALVRRRAAAVNLDPSWGGR